MIFVLFFINFIVWVISYLLAFIINLAFNLKKFKKIRFRHLLKMIPDMKNKYQRIISYFLLLVLFLVNNVVFLIAHYFLRCEQNCPFMNNNLSYYWLIQTFFSNYQINTNIKNHVDMININYTVFYKRISIKKNNETIKHRNLDSNLYPLEKPDYDCGSQEEDKRYQRQEFKDFLISHIHNLIIYPGNENYNEEADFMRQIYKFCGIAEAP